jgi:hypothetical protein
MFIHRLDVDLGLDHGSAGATGGADRAEQIGPGEATTAHGARARAAFGPNAGQRALLADTGFVLPPDLNRFADPILARNASSYSSGRCCCSRHRQQIEI